MQLTRCGYLGGGSETPTDVTVYTYRDMYHLVKGIYNSLTRQEGKEKQKARV